MKTLQKPKILVVSHDPKLADVRKAALESEGFHVLSAVDILTVRRLCRTRQKPQLVMIGYSVPPAQKRQVWIEAREHCGVPVLELYRNGTPDLMPPAFFHQAEASNDFVETVKKIVKQGGAS